MQGCNPSARRCRDEKNGAAGVPCAACRPFLLIVAQSDKSIPLLSHWRFDCSSSAQLSPKGPRRGVPFKKNEFASLP